MATDYKAMTVEALEKAVDELDKKRDALIAEHRAAAGVLSAKLSESRVKEKIDGMSPTEREQMKQLLGV